VKVREAACLSLAYLHLTSLINGKEIRNTANPRYPPSRSVIFPYSDSQILIPKIRYPPQIPATAKPHRTKHHLIYYYYIPYLK